MSAMLSAFNHVYFLLYVHIYQKENKRNKKVGGGGLGEREEGNLFGSTRVAGHSRQRTPTPFLGGGFVYHMRQVTSALCAMLRHDGEGLGGGLYLFAYEEMDQQNKTKNKKQKRMNLEFGIWNKQFIKMKRVPLFFSFLSCPKNKMSPNRFRIVVVFFFFPPYYPLIPSKHNTHIHYTHAHRRGAPPPSG